MPAEPAFSIITTIYNRARYLEMAARSVLAQTRRDLELILWDDGSTDGSLEIARRLAAGDERVRLVEAPHAGLVRSLKAANELARAPLVGWVDSDDLLMKTALEACAAALEARPDADLVYTQHLLIDEHNRAHGLGRRCGIPYSPERLLTDFMTHHFRLFRRELWTRTGGVDETLETSPDYDFCLKASEVGTIIHLAEPLYGYRIHPDAVSTARREVQIRSATEVVRRAMARRVMSQTHQLHIGSDGRMAVIEVAKRTSSGAIGADRPESS